MGVLDGMQRKTLGCVTPLWCSVRGPDLDLYGGAQQGSS